MKSQMPSFRKTSIPVFCLDPMLTEGVLDFTPNEVAQRPNKKSLNG